MKRAIGYKGIEDWNIKDIEALTENDALVLCEDRENIKGHNIYFVDFGGSLIMTHIRACEVVPENHHSLIMTRTRTTHI